MKKLINKDVLIILSTALFLRFIALILFKSWTNPDILEYGQMAENIVNGKGLSYDFYGLREECPLKSFMPPLYPFILSFLMSVVSKPYLYLLIIQAILSSSTAIIVYYIGSWIYERQTGLVAGLGVALYPVFIVCASGNFFSPTTIDIFLISLIVFFTIKADKSIGIAYPLAVGITMGISTLSLSQIIAFYPFIIFWLFINNSHHLVKKSIIIAAMIVLTISPWVFRNYVIHGRLTPTASNGGFNFWLGNNPFTTGFGWIIDEKTYRGYAEGRSFDDFIFEPTFRDPLDDFNFEPILPEAEIHNNTFKNVLKKKTEAILPRNVVEKIHELSELEIDSLLFKAGLNYIKEDPLAYIKRCYKKIFYLWTYRPKEGRRAFFTGKLGILYAVQYAFLTPLVFGGILINLRQDWRRPLLLYFLMIFFTLFYMNFFVQSRYRWLFEPYMIVVASNFIMYLWRKICRRDVPMTC